MAGPRSEDRQRPLAGVRFSLVGAGRVGSSLAHWAVAAGAVAIAVAGRRASGGGGRLASELGARWTEPEALGSAGEELLLVAVPDPTLDGVATMLAARRQARVALHTSGSRGAEALEPLAASGTAVGSLHPLKAFPRALPHLSAARGTCFAIDGAPAASELARRLARAFGGRAVEVDGELRLLYHFGATLAAGGVTTLLAAAGELAARLGLPPEVVAGYGELARGALDAARGAADPADAITGPVARQDRATVERQLTALSTSAPELLPLAVAIAREGLRQRRRRDPAGDGALDALLEAFATAFVAPPRRPS